MRDVTAVHVTVVGAGVVGLSCAVRLLEAGARVTVVSAHAPHETVSSVAAAVWYPSGFPTGDERSLTWARTGFDHLADEAAHHVPGVVMRPTRMLLRRETPVPWWAPAVPDFRVGEHEWLFTVPSVEMQPYLDHLMQRVTGAGGVIERRSVGHLAELATPVVVNASGLAARHLADDPGVYPIRGRVVLVTNPGITTSVRDEGNPAGSTYVHPRRDDIVLGGTVEPHEYDTAPDPEVSRAILERCRALVPELAHARVLREAAGLRPGRTGGIRLELVAGARHGQRVVHNYGHSGAGVTLAWGCAEETLRLVTETLIAEAEA